MKIFRIISIILCIFFSSGSFAENLNTLENTNWEEEFDPFNPKYYDPNYYGLDGFKAQTPIAHQEDTFLYEKHYFFIKQTYKLQACIILDAFDWLPHTISMRHEELQHKLLMIYGLHPEMIIKPTSIPQIKEADEYFYNRYNNLIKYFKETVRDNYIKKRDQLELFKKSCIADKSAIEGGYSSYYNYNKEISENLIKNHEIYYN